MRARCALILLACLGFSLPSAAAPPSPTPAATISPDEVERGQRGYGLSVFAGTEPERFEVEVLGVIRGLNAGVSYILARLTGHGLESAGVVAGMSGSPVYLDGRLAGAVAFGWGFSREAIAGITPIAEMRRLSAGGGEPAGAHRAMTGAPFGVETQAHDFTVDFTALASGRVPADLLERELAKLRPVLTSGATSAVQWAASGFGSESGGILSRALGSVAMAGRTREAPGDPRLSPTILQPGQMVAAVLVDGDLSLAASGTITDRTGDELLVFGHAFLGSGPVSFPLATAEVITVVDNMNSSFKLSNVGPVVGAFTEDRRAGLAGRIGAVAPMIPLAIRIEGENRRDCNLRVAEVDRFTSALLASGVVACLEAASWRSGDQALDLEATFRVRGQGPVTVRQSFDGPVAGTESASYLMATATYLLDSQLEAGRLDGVEVRLTQSATARNATLVAATPDRAVVRPGDRVKLHLDFTAFRGEPFERDLDFLLPPDLPAGKVTLLVGDGGSIDGARQALEPVEPRTYLQAVELLRSLHSRRELGVLAVLPERGVAVGGQPMPRLPGSVRTLLSAAAPGGATQLRAAIAAESYESVERPFTGLLRLDLTVERREAAPKPGATEPGAPEPAAPAGEAPGKARP